MCIAYTVSAERPLCGDFFIPAAVEAAAAQVI
jgi:hypothetical protein